MAQTLADLVVKFSADTDKFNAGMKGMSDSMQTRMDEMRQASLRASAALGALAVGSAGMVTSLVNTAKRFEVMRTQLLLTLGSTEAVNQKMKEFGQIAKDSLNFSLENVVQAGAVLEHFKKGASDVLPAITGLAERLGKDLPGTAEVFARALSGDSRSMQMLARQFNISKQTLQEFDSAFDMTGQNAQKNGEILMKYLNANYGEDLKTTAGTLESQMGTLKMTVEELSASIGTAMLPQVKEWAGMLQQVADRVNGMDDGQKKLIANIMLLTPAIAGVGSVMALFGNQAFELYIKLKNLELGTKFATTALSPFKDNWVDMRNLMKTSTFQTGGFIDKLKVLSMSWGTVSAAGVAAFAALAVAGYAFNKMLKEQIEIEKQRQQIIQQDDKKDQDRIAAFKKFTAGQKLNEEELALAITEAQRRMSFAREQGNKKSIATYQAYLDKLRAMVKGSYAEQQKMKSQGLGPGVDIAGEQAKMESQMKALERLNSEEQLTIAQKKELIGLYRTMAGVKEKEAQTVPAEKKEATLDEASGYRVKAKQLTEEMAKDAQEAEKKKQEAQKKTYEDAMSYMADLKARNEMSVAEEIAFRKRLADNDKLTADQKKENSRAIAQLAVQYNKQVAEEAKKANDDIINSEKQRIDNSISMGEMNRQEAIRQLQSLLENHKLTGEQRKKIEQEIADQQKQLTQEKKQIAEQLDDDIRRITMSAEDYEMYKIQKRVEELRAAGVEETKITQWVEAQKQYLMEKTADKGKEQVDKVKSKFEELQNELEGLNKKGGFLSMDEAMRKISLKSQLFFADSGEESTAGTNTKPTSTLPSTASNMSNNLQESGKKMATQLADSQNRKVQDTQTKTQTVVYNVYINGLKLGEEATKQIGKAVKNALVSNDDILAGAETV